MVLLVCGSRGWDDPAPIAIALAELRPKRVIHGGARGADRLAGEIAEWLGIPVMVYRADWEKWGRSAGVRRNAQMLEGEKPDMVLAFRRRGHSPGTDDMVQRASAVGVSVRVIDG